MIQAIHASNNRTLATEISVLPSRTVGAGHAKPRRAADTYDPDQRIDVCPPAGAEPLTDDEKRTFVEWIDLGAQRVEPDASKASSIDFDTGKMQEAKE